MPARRQIQATLLASLTVCAAGTNAKGTAYLEEKAREEGVVVLPSGLQYKVLQAAPNASSPTPGASTPCKCHYTGTLIDGTVFDSSRKRGSPATFAPNQVIRGWTEALQLMREGDRWQLFIPSALAYGSRGAGGRIGPDEALIFDLELISFDDSGGGPWALLTDPVVGPLAPYHLLMLAFLGWYLMRDGGGGKKASARHILVKEEELCETIKASLAGKKGPALEEAFGAAAREHSTCPSGKSAGGSLGEFGPGQMVPAFDKVCWSAPLGEVQGPVQTGFGFHLILVTGRTDPEADKAK